MEDKSEHRSPVRERRVIPVYSLLLVCVLPLPSAHEAAGATGIRRSPRPLWAEDLSTPRALRVARAKSYADSSSLRAKRSNPSFAAAMDCFAPLAMTVSKLSVSGGSGVYEKNSIVMPGLDPASIHLRKIF